MVSETNSFLFFVLARLPSSHRQNRMSMSIFSSPKAPIYHSTTKFLSSQCDCIQVRKLMTRFLSSNELPPISVLLKSVPIVFTHFFYLFLFSFFCKTLLEWNQIEAEALDYLKGNNIDIRTEWSDVHESNIKIDRYELRNWYETSVFTKKIWLDECDCC